MHKELLTHLVSSYPNAFVDSFMNLLAAALYFQGLTTLVAPEYVDKEAWEKHSATVTKSCRLSTLFHEDLDVEGPEDESDRRDEE